LEVGPATADSIALKIGVHRRTVYDNLEKLLREGLVSFVSTGRKKRYNATSPEKVVEKLGGKKEEIEKETKALLDAIPLINANKENRILAPMMAVYPGKEGVKTVWWDILKTKSPNCCIGGRSIPEFEHTLVKWHRERIKLKIPAQIIFKKQDEERGRKLSKKPFTEARVMPIPETSPITINVYGNKVGLVIVSATDGAGVIIENKEIADGFRAYFNLLWQAATKL
jgi:sugar-specific transcriptional regulator TrmB